MNRPLYLNIGSESTMPINCVNIVFNSETNSEFDATQKIPYADATVDGIVSGYLIEHLTQREAMTFLRECRRVLKPGGRIRIVSSDLATLITDCKDSQRHNSRSEMRGHAQAGGTIEFQSVVEDDKNCAQIFYEEQLSSLADWAGFAQATRCNQNESSDPYLRGLEAHTTPTLVMEYSKRIDVVEEDSLVSIIVPAYRAEFLTYCLESAIAQTYQHIEILILDDCPTDEVEEISAAYARRDPRIIYCRNTPPLGEPDSLTEGIRKARGAFIKPLYDDDFLEPDAIDRLMTALRANPDSRLAVGRRRPIDAWNKPLDDAILGPPLSLHSGLLRGTDAISQILSSGINSLGEPTCMMFRRSDALNIKEPNVMSLFGKLCFGVGDVCLATHLLSRGDLAYIAEPIAYFRVHPGQTQQQRQTRERGIESWRYLRAMGSRLGFMVAPSPQTYGRQAAQSTVLFTYQFSYAYLAYSFRAIGNASS